MVEENTRQSLLKALEDLQHDLDKKTLKLVELESVRNECEELKSLIQQIKHQLGIDIPPIEIPCTARMILGFQGNLRSVILKPIAEGISEIFDELNRRMDVNEIVTEFRKRGWKLSEKNPQEVVRSALKRNPTLFRKVSRGLWEKIRYNRKASVAPPPPEGGEIK